jgi:hypothetical protein
MRQETLVTLTLKVNEQQWSRVITPATCHETTSFGFAQRPLRRNAPSTPRRKTLANLSGCTRRSISWQSETLRGVYPEVRRAQGDNEVKTVTRRYFCDRESLRKLPEPFKEVHAAKAAAR